MTRAIKIPLRSLKPEMVSDYQEMYPGAVISIEVPEKEEDRPLTYSEFWEVIASLDWSKEGDDGQVLAPALAALSGKSVRHIIEFHELLAEKLYELDQRKFAEQIGEDAYQEGQYFSVDNFLYARSCTVANGKDFFEQVKKNPSLMPKNLTFEALLYLPSEAYKRKTGRKDYPHIATTNIETFSNKKGWP